MGNLDRDTRTHTHHLVNLKAETGVMCLQEMSKSVNKVLMARKEAGTDPSLVPSEGAWPCYPTGLGFLACEIGNVALSYPVTDTVLYKPQQTKTGMSSQKNEAHDSAGT